MTTFIVLIVTFKLIHQTLSQTCLGQYWGATECNTATENCIWAASQHSYNEGDCYPNTPTNPCGDFYYIMECGLSASDCCWYNFTQEGEACTADCGSGTPSPVTPAPTFNRIGDFCYCPDAVNITEPTASPTQKPTKSPTTPGTKKKKDKSTSGTCSINGYGDCCCDKTYGQQTLTFINLDNDTRTIETMRWWINGLNSDLNDIICEYNCIEYGESRTCNISGWNYEAGGNTRRNNDPPYDSFETNTYFDIVYVGGATCYSYFHTSCSSDIVGYWDAKDTNDCGVKCTAWTDADPNRIDDCNNQQQPCVCTNNTVSPIPTATTTPSQSPTVFINSICIPTINPTKSPTNNPIIPPTLSPSDIPSDAPSQTTNQPSVAPSQETNDPSIQPSSAPTRTRAPSIPPTIYTISPTEIPSQYTDIPSVSPTIYSNSPSKLPTGISLAPVTAIPSNSPVITDEPSDIPTQKPTQSPNELPTEFITTDDKQSNGKGKGDGFGTGNDNGDDGNMALIGGLIGGIIGAFLCGLLCAGIVFWKYKQGQNNGTASNFNAQDEHMEVEIENANNYNNSKVNSNPMFTNNRNSFETYR